MTASNSPMRENPLRANDSPPPIPAEARELQKLKEYVKLKCPTLRGYMQVGTPYVVSDSKKG